MLNKVQKNNWEKIYNVSFPPLFLFLLLRPCYTCSTLTDGVLGGGGGGIWQGLKDVIILQMEEDVFIAAGQLDMTPSAPKKTPRITPRPAPVTTGAAGHRRSTRNSSQATTADTPSSVDWRSVEGAYRGGEVTVDCFLSMALGRKLIFTGPRSWESFPMLVNKMFTYSGSESVLYKQIESSVLEF
jgi:hypothetical protein